MVPPATRLVVVAPHPDDETIAAGGLIQRVVETGGQVHVVFVTNGDGYPEAASALTGDSTPSHSDFRVLGARRLQEAAQATRTLGVSEGHLTFLGFPDGELAVLRGRCWSRWTPCASPYTGVGPFSGERLVAALERALADAQPTIVVAPDPRDVHPDHSAAGHFALAAARTLRPAPMVLTYVIHDPAWPPALRERPDLPPPGGPRYAQDSWWSLALTPHEIATKREALSKYRTQLAVLEDLLDRFVRSNEMFSRVATSGG